ncbi:Translin [Melanomma pulvis-pyrius CBS 109.77]|uniref:Translin n=1 Tax=Melanomma pulvis-pyrius CBS 109.77 TaxID=1314802 RepID=A0A6A6XGA5_9PLEO|nr:Translin [Melanomma pulvis-pyrius CBS 109.77]
MTDAKADPPSSPYLAMFERFRAELDEHHDRRERIIKASRDITAASKKIIFTLQRVRNLGEPVPQFVVKSNTQYWGAIQKQYQAISVDLQGLNRHRYRQITGGNQEFMEALSFQHYLETQTLISYDAAKARIAAMSGEGGAVELTPEDYVLGIFDMVGELMRFSITSMATNGKLPAGRPNKDKRLKQEPPEEQAGDKMDIDEQTAISAEAPEPRNVLNDLRELRLRLEMFEPPQEGKFQDDVEQKMKVMRQCVDKVEKALYSLTVRGKERPKGWLPAASEDKRAAVESY